MLLHCSSAQVVALFQSFSGGGRDLIPTFGDFAARFAANARFVAVDTGQIHVRWSILQASRGAGCTLLCCALMARGCICRGRQAKARRQSPAFGSTNRAS
jgi:hypothetical protein